MTVRGTLIPLCPGSRILVRDLGAAELVEGIERSAASTWVRILHGVWEDLTHVMRSLGNPELHGLPAADRETLAASIANCWVDRLRRGLNAPFQDFEKGGDALAEALLEERHDVARALLELDGMNGSFHLGVSDVSFYPGARPLHSLEDTYRDSTLTRREVQDTIAAFLPPGYPAFNGVIWRRLALSGQLQSALFSRLRDLPVVVLGPHHLADFGLRAGLERYVHMDIPYRNATLQRHALMHELLASHAKLGRGGELRVTYLFVAGLLGTWLATKLHGKMQNATIIDIGRALDAYYRDDEGLVKQYDWRWLC